MIIFDKYDACIEQNHRNKYTAGIWWNIFSLIQFSCIRVLSNTGKKITKADGV